MNILRSYIYEKPFSYTELIIPLIKKGKDYSDFLLPRVDHFFYGELIQGYATYPRRMISSITLLVVKMDRMNTSFK